MDGEVAFYFLDEAEKMHAAYRDCLIGGWLDSWFESWPNWVDSWTMMACTGHRPQPFVWRGA
jgi:hypothetical protein